MKSNDTCRIATIGTDDWPHCVPVGYVYRNGRFFTPANKNSKKVLNLRNNRRACIVIDDEQERVLMLQGPVEIAEDKRFMKFKEWMVAKTGWTIGDKTAILVLRPEKKASWKLT